MSQIDDIIRVKARVQLHLGGNLPSPGFIVMSEESGAAVDIRHSFDQFPYPLKDSTVDLLVAPDLVEHINPIKKGFIHFMDECWRILKPGAQFMIATPYAGSKAYYQDPTHCNPCNEATFYYFDPMRANGVLYSLYKPKPWKIVKIAWANQGNMEVLLEKRLLDKSYD